ncbi:shortage in chiasmata 1 ortholog-like, partial [Homarus americanus]
MEEPTGESISAKKRKTSERDDSVCGGDDGVNGRKGGEEITLVASNSVTNNAELHYILTSIYNINLVERCLRDVVVDEDEGHGWPDLLLDERTCVVLQPLAQLRTDTNLNRLTCQLVLLSLQCTTCYIILYSHPPTDSGIFPTNKQQLDNKWRAIDNIKFPDCMKNQRNTDLFYKEMSSMKDDFGEPYFRELLYFALEILSLPTSNVDERIFSKHERLLLSLPCINSITAQIILTAMSLPDVLTLPLSNLISALPWIPNKVVTTLYGLLHGDAVSVINSYGTTKPLSNVPSLPTKTEDAAASEPLLVDVSEHDQPNVVNQTLSYSDYVEGRVLEESTQLYVNDREVPDVVLLSPYAYHDKSVFTQNTKVECPDTTLSTCVTEAAGNHHTSLHGAFPSIPPEGKYLGNLFNAKDFLGSVPSTAATSLDHQQLTRMQRITATHQVSQVHQQMSQLPEQQQAVPQFYQETQQQIPHQYQHRQYTQQVPQPHQQVSQPQQMPLLHQEISQMQQILQPPLPSQLPKPVPQLQQEIPLLPPSSLQHQQHHVQHYYPQQQEEIVVLSPYFPEVQNDYTQPIGNLPQDVVIPVPASQHNRPSGVSTSEPQGYHGSVTRQGMYCGNVYQQQQLQQQKQQQQLQQQQLQHQQSHLPQGYWNGSPSLHQQPLTLRPLGNKIFGVAKPYQHH